MLDFDFGVLDFVIEIEIYLEIDIGGDILVLWVFYVDLFEQLLENDFVDLELLKLNVLVGNIVIGVSVVVFLGLIVYVVGL